MPGSGTNAAASAPSAPKKTKTSKAKRRNQRRLTGPTAAKPYVPTIAVRSIDGHIVRTQTTVTAWYRLRPQRWEFRSDHDRTLLMQAIAGQYADLKGRWLHLRVTSRPYPISAWAEAHVRNVQHQLPDTPGALTFDDYMVGEQMQLRGLGMSNKEVFLGVEVRRRKLTDTLVEQARPVLERVWPTLVDAELTALEDEVGHIDNVIGGEGLQGRPVSDREMHWLMTRSCQLGLPVRKDEATAGTGQWDEEDLAAFSAGADFFTEPYAPTVTVRGRAGRNAGVQRQVAVLTLGRMQDLIIPERDQPWMQLADTLPVPVEWSARFYIRHDDEVKAELDRNVDKVNSQYRHYTEEHGRAAPKQLERQAARAHDIEDELSAGFHRGNTRLYGWWRLAVSGRSSREALKYAQRIVDLAKPEIEIEHPEAQYRMAREFIPGEPLASTAYRRRGSVLWAASAMPSATAQVGDRRGVLLGETAGGIRRPVAWDPWLAQETRNGSGLTAMVAGLGGGKSFLGGGIVYKTLRAGAHWMILDPSGPLARLAQMPELRPYSRVINLLDAQPGILNPYRVVPEPVREDFEDETDPAKALARARTLASATRRRLCLDVLMGVLPYALARDAQTHIVLLGAIRAVGGGIDRHPGLVISQLQRTTGEHREHAQIVADALDDLRSQLALLIPEDGIDPYAQMRQDRLTVLTMPGLVLPQGDKPREVWTDAEALGVELLSLSAWLTQRQLYTGPPGYFAETGMRWKDQRKGVWIDEAFFLSQVSAGRVLMDRMARDSRKWNVRVLLSSQVPADFLRIPGFAALVDSVLVGRLSGEAEVADALRLLGIPVGVGYEAVLERLAQLPNTMDEIDGAEPGFGTQVTQQQAARAPRQFLFNDGGGGLERICIDFSGDHLAGLRDALDTTPGAPAQITASTPPVPPLQQHLQQHLEQPDQNTDHDAELDIALNGAANNHYLSPQLGGSS
ncbi:ATP-binding protein [Amycolatopsis sp. NPDC058986]|uniref:ATP-binding protein n=1 Tax=unclassified Amycolatopsis TaxID=2618356 RepID=UPI00366EEE3F